MIYRLLSALVLLLPSLLLAQVTNEFFNDGADVYVQAGGLIYVQGEVINQDNGANVGRMFNSGDIQLQGDWYNYSPSNVFQSFDPGTTTFLGNNPVQMIDGSFPTAFNNLTLNKPGVTLEVRMDIDASSDGVLNLTNDFLNTQVDTFAVLNANPNAITRTGPTVPNYINNVTDGFVTSTSGSGGRLIRTTSNAFPGGVYLFPVGTLTRGFRPVEITPSSLGTNFYSVQLVDLATPNPLVKDPSISSIHPNWYHFIGRTIPLGSPEDIRIYYDQIADDACDPSTVTMSEWTGAIWDDLDPAVASIGLASPILSHATKAAYPANYPGIPFNTERFVLGDKTYAPWGFPCTLPVELLFLKAKPLVSSIQLDWKTASEVQNKGFELQRSEEGGNYEVVAWKDGAGTTSDFVSYAHEDKEVRYNIEYTYRLKQFDLNGGHKFSNEVNAILIPGNDLWVGELFPNPANRQAFVEIHIPNSGLLSIEYFNALGQKVFTSQENLMDGINKIELKLNSLSAGAYMVSFTLEGKKFNKKLVVE